VNYRVIIPCTLYQHAETSRVTNFILHASKEQLLLGFRAYAEILRMLKVLNIELTNSTQRLRSQSGETFTRVNKAPLRQVL